MIFSPVEMKFAAVKTFSPFFLENYCKTEFAHNFESGKVEVEGTWFFFTNFLLCESGLTMESMSTNFNDFFFYIFV